MRQLWLLCIGEYGEVQTMNPKQTYKKHMGLYNMLQSYMGGPIDCSLGYAFFWQYNHIQSHGSLLKSL